MPFTASRQSLVVAIMALDSTNRSKLVMQGPTLSSSSSWIVDGLDIQIQFFSIFEGCISAVPLEIFTIELV